MVDSGFTRGEIVQTPLSDWFVEMAVEHDWTSQHQAALYLEVKQPALNKWLRAKYFPSPYYQRHLAAKTGRPRAFVEDLVERSRAMVAGAAPRATHAPAGGILTPMGVIDCVRAYLDRLAAQIAAGTLTDADARALLDEVNAARQPNGSQV